MKKVEFEINEDDIQNVKKILTKVKEPVSIDFLASKMQDLLAKKSDFDFSKRLIKIYDSNCDYNTGDIVYKEFKKLRLSQRKFVDFNNFSVGTIYEIIKKQDEEFDLICVDWEDPLVRRQNDFYRSTSATHFMPINYGRKPPKIKYLGMDFEKEDREIVLKQYEQNLLSQIKDRLLNFLFYDSDFANWGSRWYLAEQVEEVEYLVINDIEKTLRESEWPVPTDRFVEKAYKIKQDNPKFLHLRFSINFTLENFFNEKFICLSHFGGGKWELREKLTPGFGSRTLRLCAPKLKKSIKEMNKFLDESLWEEPLKKLMEDIRESQKELFKENELRKSISLHEFVSGSFDVPVEISTFFPDDTELVFLNPKTGEQYPVTYHYQGGFIENLGKFYHDAHLLPGAIIILRKTGSPTGYNIVYERAMEKYTYPELEYNLTSDLIKISDQLFESDCLKDMRFFIEPDKLPVVAELSENLKTSASSFDVIVKIFQRFGVTMAPLEIAKLAYAISHMTIQETFSILSSYKCFQLVSDETVKDNFRLNPIHVATRALKKNAKGNLVDFIEKKEDKIEKRPRFYRPRVYIYKLPMSYWNIAKDFDILPISSLAHTVDIRPQDRVVIMVENEVGAAVELKQVREFLQPHLRTLFKEKNFISSVDFKLIGEGTFTDITIYQTPETGVFVELDENTFARIKEYYSSLQKPEPKPEESQVDEKT